MVTHFKLELRWTTLTGTEESCRYTDYQVAIREWAAKAYVHGKAKVRLIDLVDMTVLLPTERILNGR